MSETARINEVIKIDNGFVGYEYKSITVKSDFVDIYADCFPSFGWTLEETKEIGKSNFFMMKFKRDRKTTNKVELKRLGHEFESHVREINKLEISKKTFASIFAYTIGILGTAFMAGSVFAVTSNMILLCIILAVPAFTGWVMPYFCYKHLSEKKSEEVTGLIDEQYDAIYATCEKANVLLYK